MQLNDEYKNLDVLSIDRDIIEGYINTLWNAVVSETNSPTAIRGYTLAHALGFFKALSIACPYTDLKQLSKELADSVLATTKEVPEAQA